MYGRRGISQAVLSRVLDLFGSTSSEFLKDGIDKDKGCNKTRRQKYREKQRNILEKSRLGGPDTVFEVNIEDEIDEECESAEEEQVKYLGFKEFVSKLYDVIIPKILHLKISKILFYPSRISLQIQHSIIGLKYLILTMMGFCLFWNWRHSGNINNIDCLNII